MIGGSEQGSEKRFSSSFFSFLIRTQYCGVLTYYWLYYDTKRYGLYNPDILIILTLFRPAFTSSMYFDYKPSEGSGSFF